MLIHRRHGYESPWFPFGTFPHEWIVRGGKPAAILGKDGMPSYEPADDEVGGLWIYEFMSVFAHEHGLAWMLLPRSYAKACLLAPEGPVAVHMGQHARYAYRPKIWQLTWNVGWQFLGSQLELAWRYGLAKAVEMQVMAEQLEMALKAEDRADIEWCLEQLTQIKGELELTVAGPERAEEWLLENLSPQQRIEYRYDRNFRCRGGRTGNLYQVENGNGFRILDPDTQKCVVSYCLHPEGWLPHEDVQLATKLALEDPELEIDCLENANQSIRMERRPTTFLDRVAAKYEKELIR